MPVVFIHFSFLTYDYLRKNYLIWTEAPGAVKNKTSMSYVSQAVISIQFKIHSSMELMYLHLCNHHHNQFYIFITKKKPNPISSDSQGRFEKMAPYVSWAIAAHLLFFPGLNYSFTIFQLSWAYNGLSVKT